MPVTKKKGAIFAIYADTPPRAGPSSSSAAAPAPADDEPTRPLRASSSRRALTPIEPTPVARKGFPSALPHPSSSTSTSTSKDEGPSKPAMRRALSSKPSRTRSHLEVFADPVGEPSKPLPSASSKPLSSKSKPLSFKPLSSKPLSSKPLSSKPLSSKPLSSKPLSQMEKTATQGKSKASREPLKAKRPRSPTDKENALPDSPASRTRSKARLALASNENSGQSFQDKLLAAGKKAPSKTRKPFAVFADSPLADVSEAYGASGDEPAGFRDQAGQAKKRVGRAIRS